jgi:hypothetical protein
VSPYADPARQREYQRDWMARRRAEALEGRACIDCGATERLEFDHRDPAEKLDHRVWSWSVARITAELAKCDVRCAHCHRRRHAAERRRHGIKRYQGGCRCDICRAAKSVANARYLERRRRESNPDERLCRPPRSRSATSPDAAEAYRDAA